MRRQSTLKVKHRGADPRVETLSRRILYSLVIDLQRVRHQPKQRDRYKEEEEMQYGETQEQSIDLSDTNICNSNAILIITCKQENAKNRVQNLLKLIDVRSIIIDFTEKLYVY